ncbi:MAG TPA: class A beta-lactamase [Bryobacteraceae bacterium]|jgi:beta-lactamase class A|nr:class A beta-lactamase [Bryobacteraceae bacterium]
MRVVCLCLIAAYAAAGAADSSLARLEQQMELVSHATDGVVGVDAIHLESGREASLRSAEGFPMASAFKLPMAVQIMSMVDDGKLTLDKMVSLAPPDLHPGSGRLTELFFHPGVSLSIANLLELAIVISDNTAADLLLREAGGPSAVTAKMRTLGLPGIRIDRSTALLISDWQGAKNLPPESQWNREIWDKIYDAVPDRDHMRARRTEMTDPRDTATPNDMTRLLVRLWKRDILTPESARVILDMMERCQTGKSRIKGLLPQGTDVAHKTGSLGGVANDIGFITLPGDAGHVAISVFTRSSNKPEEAAERAIAEIARTVYDYFVLVPAGGR